MHKFNFQHNSQNSLHFLWFTWFNNKCYAFVGDISGPLWLKPKIIREKKTWHIGWLYFQVGFAWN